MQDYQTRSESELVQCYAVRRVNPFRGVMQVIHAPEGRALSCNGILWEILVRARHGDAPNPAADKNGKKTYYRFGIWSKAEGLMRRANSPVPDEDYFELASECDTLVEHVRDHLEQLPFALKDDLELWLFDQDNQRPLALLASLVPGASLPSPKPKDWSAGIGANGSASQRRFPQAPELEAQVMQRAGIYKYWLKRVPSGEGVMENREQVIPAEHFPTLLLDERWENEEEQSRAVEYIKWIAPSLLTLQHLDRITRTRLENYLNVQAISIEHHWHLYPEIIDQGLLKAARVQSQIQQAG